MTEEELLEFEEELKKREEALDCRMKEFKAEERLFNQKLEILKASYMQLDSEKRFLDKEKLKFESEKKHFQYDSRDIRKEAMAVAFFFRGCNNILALKKRYKDLIKIFHPDNLCGDKETLQMINREYEDLCQEFERSMKQA